MKRRRVLFMQLSHIRLLVKKFALVILFLLAFVLMLLNKTDTILIDKTSSVATSVFSPVIDVLILPARGLAEVYDYFKDMRFAYQENKLLKAENRQLRIISEKARALEIENRLLAKLLNYTSPNDEEMVTVRVVAEEGDAFSHSVIAYIGDEPVKKGQVAISDKGVVGRVDRVGNVYAKILLLTDINSKIPVMVEKTRIRGILSGDNTPLPKMIFIPLGADLNIGDRIVTSGVAGVFPAGLPIGRVVSVNKNEIRVKAFSNLEQLDYVKLVNYGLDGIISEEPEGKPNNE